MNQVEERIHAAVQAAAGSVRDVRPLVLPPPADGRPRLPGSGARARRARRLRTWVSPLTAAAAVIALAISLVVVRDIPNGRVVPPASPAPTVAGVPRYYVALVSPDGPGGVPTKALVGDTFTGAVVTSVSAPPGWSWYVVLGAADDRTFVLAAQSLTASAEPLMTWYKLTRSRSGAGFSLSKLPVPSTRDAVTPLALSPDGSKLAVGLADGSGVGTLRIYSVVTGAELHAWSANVSAFIWASWSSDGNQLDVSYAPKGTPHGADARMLQVNLPGNDLHANSRPVWTVAPVAVHLTKPDITAVRPFSCGQPGHIGGWITPDGKTLVCPASGVFRSPRLPAGVLCPAIPAWNDEGILEYSTATGQLIRTLYKGSSNCVPNHYPVQISWISASGDAVIGYLAFGNSPPVTSRFVTRFGVFSAHKFTPLPAPPTSDAGAVAW